MTTRKPWQLPSVGAIALALLVCFAGLPGLHAQRVIVGSGAVRPVVAAEEMGALPASQMLTLRLNLNSGVDRGAALDELLAAQIAPGSPQYRQWLTPAEFAASFGATDAQIATVSAWLESNGLTVTAVSPSRLRMTVTGSGAQVEAAFAVHLRQYRAMPDAAGNRALTFANREPASVPDWVAPLIGDVSGLDNQPFGQAMVVTPITASGGQTVAAGTDPLSAIEGIVDADAASVLSIASEACSKEFAPLEIAAWRAVLKQAEAQGITVLATGGCGAGAFPACLPEVTAVVRPDASTAAVSGTSALMGVAPRPEWQFAAGLPDGVWREAPDLAVAGESGEASEAALGATLEAISRHAGARLGNVAPVLYQLATAPGLFTHPDGAAAGVWEEATGLGVVDLKRLAELFPMGSTGTSSLLTVSNYAPYHGQPLTLTATVTSTGGSGLPTGTVTFTSTQKGTLGTATLNASGVATFTSNSLQAGMYTTTSVYSGDANYAGSTSGVATITILGEPSLMTATVEPGAAVGGNATIDVSITSASGVGTPSGTVTVAPQGTTNSATATATLAGSGGTATAKVPLPVYQAGQFTLLVSCSDPDPSFTCYSPVSVQMTVAKGATSTALSSSPLNPAVGQSYTLTATVSGSGANAAAASSASKSGSPSAFHRIGSGRSAAKPFATGASTAPTGNVQFMDGTQYLGTAAIANGVATYTGTATSATHSFNAMYSGDGNYGTSSSSTPAVTGTTPTSTSLTASTYAIAVGQNITFYSTVFAAGVPSTMTGTVTFSAAAQGVIGTGIVANGLATLTIGTLAAGTYSMTATYSGDSVFAPSTSTSSVIVTVAGGSATLGGSFTPASVPYGSDAVLTATASFASGSSGPSGSLTATIGGVTGAVYTQTLVASATSPTSSATFTFPAPPPGVYSVTISCPAADTFTCGAPATVPLTVVRGGTATALTLTPPAPLAGQPTTLTATISNTGGDPHTYTFTGTVNFYANNQLLKSAAVSGVSASVSVGLPSGAEESITAVYSGDTNWTASTSAPVVLSVTALPTSTVVTSNVTSVLSGVQVLLTATVTDIAGGPLAATAPSGVVSFYDTLDGVLSGLGTATLVGNGANTSVATLNVTGLAAGTHSIYAVYAGDSVYLGSTSAAISLGSTNYAGTFVPATMTLNRGQTGQASLVVNFQGGFGGTVSFGCTPPPNIEMTCSFSPTVLTASGTTTLVVGTVAPSSASAAVRNEASPAGSPGVRLAGGAALAMLLLCIRPRRLSAVVVLLLAMGTLLGATGCSGTNLAKSGTPPPVTPTDPGTSLGTQILAITTAGSDGTNTVRHDFQYQVTVQ